jgi:hypothetical protein
MVAASSSKETPTREERAWGASVGKLHSLFAAFIFVFGIAILPAARGQDAAGTSASTHSLRYRLVDVGTLGGPSTYQPFGFADAFLTERALSARGTFAGFSATPNADPYDRSVSSIVLSTMLSNGETES